MSFHRSDKVVDIWTELQLLRKTTSYYPQSYQDHRHLTLLLLTTPTIPQSRAAKTVGICLEQQLLQTAIAACFGLSSGKQTKFET